MHISQIHPVILCSICFETVMLDTQSNLWTKAKKWYFTYLSWLRKSDMCINKDKYTNLAGQIGWEFHIKPVT